MTIEEAIKQTKPLDEKIKADINIMYTASWLGVRKMAALKEFNISWQQFNILRILRGKSPEAVSMKWLTERMIDKMSNTSRLVEKLRSKGFVERKACIMDRRKVDIWITEAGLESIAAASLKLENEIYLVLSNFSREEASELNRLLDKIRDNS